MEEQSVFPIPGKMFSWHCCILWSKEHKHPHGCSDAGGGAVLLLEFLGRCVTHQASPDSINRTVTWAPMLDSPCTADTTVVQENTWGPLLAHSERAQWSGKCHKVFWETGLSNLMAVWAHLLGSRGLNLSLSCSGDTSPSFSLTERGERVRFDL